MNSQTVNLKNLRMWESPKELWNRVIIINRVITRDESFSFQCESKTEQQVLFIQSQRKHICTQKRNSCFSWMLNTTSDQDSRSEMKGKLLKS